MGLFSGSVYCSDDLCVWLSLQLHHVDHCHFEASFEFTRYESSSFVLSKSVI